MKSGRITLSLLVVTALAVAVGYLIGFGLHDQDTAEAAGGPVGDPNGVAPDRYVYYPGTEPLGHDEIRIIACGTGMPAARRGQAASCWVFELGSRGGDTRDGSGNPGSADGQRLGEQLGRLGTGGAGIRPL